jgi:hypothetical protein
VWQRPGPLGVALVLPAVLLLGWLVRVPEPVGEPPAVVAMADADVRGDVEASATPWTEARKEHPPTLSIARRTAAVRTDARVMPER